MVVLNLLSWIPLVGFAIPKTTIQNRNCIFRVCQNRQVSVISLLHQSSFGIQQDVEQRHRCYVSESTNLDNDSSKIIQIPKFVSKVTDWLGSIPVEYTLQCQPLSSIIVNPNDSRCISTSISQQHEQLLYMVQIEIPTKEQQNEESNSEVSSTSSSSSSPNSTSSVLILHLISSPTSIHDYIPPGITRSMTENPYQLQFVTTNDHNNDHNNTIHNNNDTTIQQIQIIHLHEDIWDNQRTNRIVKARILCRLRTILLSLNNHSNNHNNHNYNTYNYRRLYARQTYVQRIDRIVAIKFLNQHHLWGTTHSFKYAYGLYQKQTKNNNNNQNDNNNNSVSTSTKKASLDDEMLVAVATFSGKRNVRRGQEQDIYRSYELLRVCTCCDTSVIGSISKLLSVFIKEYNVDDIVTVIDRDWGIGQSNWYTLGFTTVTIMAPIPMVIHSQSGIRHHLIGAGISHNTNPINTNGRIDQHHNDRLGLPPDVINELERITSYDAAVQCLDRHGYYLVFDVGVERLVHFVSKQTKSKVLQVQSNDNNNNNNVQFDVTAASTTATTIDLWNNSTPQYATQHYSNIAGINALIQKQN